MNIRTEQERAKPEEVKTIQGYEENIKIKTKYKVGDEVLYFSSGGLVKTKIIGVEMNYKKSYRERVPERPVTINDERWVTYAIIGHGYKMTEEKLFRNINEVPIKDNIQRRR